MLDGAKLLYLATKAGASALALDHEVGDFGHGKSADLVCLRPRPRTPLATVIDQAETPDRILTTLFTLAGAESVSQVRVGGSIVYENC